MKCKTFLRSRLLLRVLPLFLSCVVFLSSTIGISAESVTPTPTPSTYDGTWVINTYDFLQLLWTSGCREISKYYMIGSDAIYGEFEHFLTWLEGDPNYGVLEQYPNTVVHSPVPPTGNTLIDLNNSTSIDVPVPVQNTILNFIQYQVAQNPTSYKECYIPSYNFLNPQYFPNYNMYVATKDFIKQSGGYCVITPTGMTNGVYRGLYITVIPRDLNLAFVGTTLEGGFTNVRIYVNWYDFGNSAVTPLYTNKVINADGTVSNGEFVTPSNVTLKNVSTPDRNTFIVNSNLDKNELVYVFGTLNAYKNYNSGLPQDYYLTSEGINDPTWTVNGSGTINTGSMDNSSYYYNSVVSTVQTGWTAEEVLALVDKISGSTPTGSGTGGGSSDNTGLWSGIGEALGALISGIATVISKVAEALSNAILSIINIFVGDDGLFAKLTDLIDTGFQNFLSGVFSWMPQEIVTLFSATLIFGIFFAIWKMLRG